MRIIKKLAEQINEEVDGAIDYAMEALRDRVGQLETAQMLNPIEARLAQVPTYPNGYVYNAGPNPFCTCNQGCGNI